MDQGSTMKRSAVHNFAPTVTKFCVMWEGQALPHDTKFGNSRCEIVGRRVIFIWSLIHGLRWSGLIKAEPGYVLLCQPVLSIRICSSQNRIYRNLRASFSFGLTYNSKNTAVTYLSDIRARRISSYHINLGENANQTKAINWNTQMCIIIWWVYIITMMFV